MTLYVGVVTDEERDKIERLTHARSAPIRLVRRARMGQMAIKGMTAPANRRALGISEQTVRISSALPRRAWQDWTMRRAGRPRTSSEDLSSRVIALARGPPPTPAEGAVPSTRH
jgi:hypothetical protein